MSVHPTILTWTDFGEAIVDGMPVAGSNVYDMLDCLFHDWRKLSKQSPPQGLDKLIRSLFQNGYDPRNVVDRRVRFLNCVNDMSLSHEKRNAVRKQGIRWSVY